MISLLFLAVGCGSTQSTGSTPDDSDSATASDDWRNGAYADIDLTYDKTNGDQLTWSFRLEDGDPNTGSRYSDVVEYHKVGDDDDFDWVVQFVHRGCPDGEDTNTEPLDDRPTELELSGYDDGDQYSGGIDFTLPEDVCDPSGTRQVFECLIGPGADNSRIDADISSSGSGSISAYAHCTEDNRTVVGYLTVSASFKARLRE